MYTIDEDVNQKQKCEYLSRTLDGIAVSIGQFRRLQGLPNPLKYSVG
jgi:hypothetical protein